MVADDFDPAEFAAAKPSVDSFDPVDFAASKSAAQPQTFGQKLGALWEHPPAGPSVIGTAKSIYEAGKSALGAYPATEQRLSMPEPTKEEDYPAYRQQQEELQRQEFLGAAGAASLLSPTTAGRGLGGLFRGPVRTAPSPVPDVLLSEGQATGELPLIRREQAAFRGQLGPDAEAHARDFFQQQKQQVDANRLKTSMGLDPFGQQVVQGPQEAGAVISDAVKQAAAQAKAGIDARYTQARAFPGEIHASAFEGIGNTIKNDLTARPEPIIVDDKLTPYASAAIKQIENNVSNLQIQNRADPLGQPSSANIVGVNLAGVDQWRKTLSSYTRQAYQSGNAADGRATRAVLDAFDDHIDQSVNSGLFNGDPRAVQAWNDARAAYSDYRKTFTASKGDPVGRVVERIIGKGNTPAAIPNDVADFMYGSMGVNPNTLNVSVSNRIKNIVGDQSPEWSAVKQGLFSRLTETPPGVTDWGPGQVAQKLNKFLNGDGKEMAQAIYSPQDRKTIQDFANLQRQLEVPPTGANRSETSTFVAPLLRKLSGRAGIIAGAILGRTLMPGMPPVISEAIGVGTAMGAGKVANLIEARNVAKQMPMITDALKKYNKANADMGRLNTPPANAALGVATANLMRSLQSFGVDMSGFQLPVTSRADQNQ